MRRKVFRNLAIALILSLVIRFTLYVEDCNLLVMAFTFLFLFGAVTVADWSVQKIQLLLKKRKI